MAKIENSIPKTSSGGYDRVFGDAELGNLMTRVQSTVISNGNELEKMILERTNNIYDLDKFIDEATEAITPDGVYVCPKKVTKKSSYAIDGNEPDLIIFIIQKRRVCKIIELKDGDNFDTKKSLGEKEHLEEFAKKFGAKIPFVTDFFICAFNQSDKKVIKAGFKGVFDEAHILTGRELCDILQLDYDKIVKIRNDDAEQNREYFVGKLIQIEWIKKILSKNRS